MFHPNYILYKSLLEQTKERYSVVKDRKLMSKKIVDEEDSLKTLQEMVKERKKGEPVEEVLAIFCERYGVEMGECRSLYNKLVKQGKMK